MSIGGINSYSNFYNSYSLRDIPRVDAQEVQNQEHRDYQNLQGSGQEENAGITESSCQPPAEDGRSRSADLENISLTFHANDEGGAIGRDSNILNLDMQKAISDMKKDRILEDYQYFVGSAQELKAKTAGIDEMDGNIGSDGIVIQKF